MPLEDKMCLTTSLNFSLLYFYGGGGGETLMHWRKNTEASEL